MGSGVLLFGALATSVTAQIADPAITFRKNGALWVMNADASNQKQILSASGSIVAASLQNWSPDGQWITYRAGDKNYVISKSGGVPSLLSGDTIIQGNPVWSPLGDRVAYTWAFDTGGTGPWDVRAAPVRGGPIQILYRFQYPQALLGSLSWSPDATKTTVAIYDYSLTTSRKSSLNLLDTVLGTVQDLTHPLGFDWTDGRQADWARRHNWIAFCGAKIGESSALWILDLDLGQARKLLPSLSYASPSWSPDDSRIVFQKLVTTRNNKTRGELWTVDVLIGLSVVKFQRCSGS